MRCELLGSNRMDANAVSAELADVTWVSARADSFNPHEPRRRGPYSHSISDHRKNECHVLALRRQRLQVRVLLGGLNSIASIQPSDSPCSSAKRQHLCRATGDVIAPSLHQGPALVPVVTPRIGSFGGVRDTMSECGLHDGVRS